VPSEADVSFSGDGSLPFLPYRKKTNVVSRMRLNKALMSSQLGRRGKRKRSSTSSTPILGEKGCARKHRQRIRGSDHRRRRDAPGRSAEACYLVLRQPAKENSGRVLLQRDPTCWFPRHLVIQWPWRSGLTRWSSEAPL